MSYLYYYRFDGDVFAVTSEAPDRVYAVNLTAKAAKKMAISKDWIQTHFEDGSLEFSKNPDFKSGRKKIPQDS